MKDENHRGKELKRVRNKENRLEKTIFDCWEQKNTVVDAYKGYCKKEPTVVREDYTVARRRSYCGSTDYLWNRQTA